MERERTGDVHRTWKLENSRPFSGGSSHDTFHSTCHDLVSPWANVILRVCVCIVPLMDSGRACTICPVHNDVFSPRITEVTTGGKESFIWDHHHFLPMSLDEIQYSVGHPSESPEPSSL